MKEFFYGIISMVVFLIKGIFLEMFVSPNIFGTDFNVSFHLFTYTGLIMLCGVGITCFCILNRKLEEIKSMLSNMKEESIDLDANKEE